MAKEHPVNGDYNSLISFIGDQIASVKTDLRGDLNRVENNIESKFMMAITPLQKQADNLRIDIIDLYGKIRELKDSLSDLEKKQAIDDNDREHRQGKAANYISMFVAIVTFGTLIFMMVSGG